MPLWIQLIPEITNPRLLESLFLNKYHKLVYTCTVSTCMDFLSFDFMLTDPGTIQFEKPSFLFKESCGTARIPVQRVNGADGELKTTWKTKDISAIGGRDFDQTKGELVFKHGEVEKHIEITINDDMVMQTCIVHLTLLEYYCRCTILKRADLLSLTKVTYHHRYRHRRPHFHDLHTEANFNIDVFLVSYSQNFTYQGTCVMQY